MFIYQESLHDARSTECEKSSDCLLSITHIHTHKHTELQTFTLALPPQVCSRLVKGKGKAVPLESWSGPEGSRKLRFPDFTTKAQDGGKVVSLTHRLPLPSRKYTWYSFLLEAESTTEP